MDDLRRLASVPSFYPRSEMESGIALSIADKKERCITRGRERRGERERKREDEKEESEKYEVRVPYYVSISIDCN